MLINEIPQDAEPLSESGFFAWASAPIHDQGIQIHIYRQQPDGRVGGFPACGIMFPRTYPSAWTAPARMSDVRHSIQVLTPPSNLGPASARAFAETLQLAAELLPILDEAIEPAIKRAEEQRAEREKQREADRARWQAEREENARRRALARQMQAKRAQELYEHVRWLLDHKFRLRRDGHKSTVFGTILSVSEPRTSKNLQGEEVTDYFSVGMSTISEKDVSMYIYLRDINCMDVKYDGDRRYTNIYDATKEAEPA